MHSVDPGGDPHTPTDGGEPPSGERFPTNIFLVGMMGAGKSAIGNRLAARLGHAVQKAFKGKVHDGFHSVSLSSGSAGSESSGALGSSPGA